MKDMILYIPPKIHAEIMFHVHKSDVEVSGLGRLTKTSNGNLIVSKVYLLEQTNSATTTDICPEALAKLQYESREDKGDLNFWWHSHVNMGVNWSGTDTDTFEEFGKHGMLVGTVFNKKGEHRSAIYQGGNEFFPYIWKDNIDTSFGYLPTQEEADAWNTEHEAKCKKKSYAMPNITMGRQTGKSNLKNWIKDPITGKWHDESLYSPPAKGIEPPIAPTNNDNVDTMTFSGELVEEVLTECEAHIESQTPWEAIHNYDQFYWWDMYEYLYGQEPQGDPEVEAMYNQLLTQPHLFSMMIYQREQELLAEEQPDVKKAPKAAAPNTNTKGKK